MRAWQGRKSWLADLSAGIALALVELGLRAFLMHLGLLDPVQSRRPAGDSPNLDDKRQSSNADESILFCVITDPMCKFFSQRKGS